MTGTDIIDEQRIGKILAATAAPGFGRLEEILSRARELGGLSLEETAELLAVDDLVRLERIFSSAKFVKDAIYGCRIVLFAPLYISNYCSNDCLYCGFRRSNTNILRKQLSMDEIAGEVRALEDMGHKRLLLVFGEGPRDDADFIVEAINRVYATTHEKGEIRRVNVNCAPLSVEDFRKLKDAGIGTYQIFQETYHRETYRKMHPSGRKADYDWRITAIDRAMEAGIDDIGIGPLFGLYDYRFEVLSVIAHSRYLDTRYGVGPHTISVPRLEPAEGSEIASNPPYPVSDLDFMKIVAVLRLAVPYTGIILSTRERAGLRDELFELGVSQISAGSKTTPGGYEDADLSPCSGAQFQVGDGRSADEIIYELARVGHIPSFCTACYRAGRTGQDFMQQAKPGLIQEFCTPNAMLTFKEYLLDYADPKTRELGEAVLRRHVDAIPNQQLRTRIQDMLSQMEKGQRDLFL